MKRLLIFVLLIGLVGCASTGEKPLANKQEQIPLDTSPAVDWIQSLISFHYSSHAEWANDETELEPDTWDDIPLPSARLVKSSNTKSEYIVEVSEYDYQGYHFPSGTLKIEFFRTDRESGNSKATVLSINEKPSP